MGDDLRPLGPNDRDRWRVGFDHADLLRPSLPPHPVRFSALPKAVTLDLARSALVVIDMQNDFLHPDGWLAGIGVDVAPARTCVEPLAALVPMARAAGMPVIWVNWGVRADRANLSPALRHVYDPAGRGGGLGDPAGPRASPVLSAGSWGAAVIDDLAPDPADIRICKHRMSGFWDTPLDSVLRRLRVDTLLFGGVNADQCVLHTLADANFLGYDTILVEDATATTSPAFCLEATLYNIRQIFGFTCRAEVLRAAFAEAQP